ncbi:MAG TPA: hypothetical protein VF510_13025 [Ktedonobacterales bacterium]
MRQTPQTNGSAGAPDTSSAPPHSWIEQLDALLSLLGDDTHAGDEAEFLRRLTTLDPDLLAFLVERIAEEDSPQAATVLEVVAAQPETPGSVRERARAARDALAARGITPTPPGEERFYSGWVQRGRERGEQILILGWRMPGGAVEALVFLLDWRGDGLKDFYRTRDMQEGEWRELLEHNGDKGAPLTEITLAQGRALIEAALAESKRFSRPVPREYKLESQLIERRVLESGGALAPDDELAAQEALVAPDLSPDEVVKAYVAALHHRDYALAMLLLAAEHQLRAGQSRDAALTALRAQLKHAPRREEDVRVASRSDDTETPADQTGAEADEAIVEAHGAEVAVERTGRRVRSEVHERYVLRRSASGWRILSSNPV